MARDDGTLARSALLGTSFAVAMLAIAVAFARPGPALCDDAYISLRYARNLAAGHGPVFNPGERVEGYSNLSWTLLLALLELTGVPGAIHEKVDLDDVLGRRPEAVVLRLARLMYGLPHDRRMVSYGPFLASYRLRHVEPFGPSAYLVFTRTEDPVSLLVPRIDLTSRLRAARIQVAGSRATPRRLIHGSYPFFVPQEALARMQRLQKLIPARGSVDAATVATLDAGLHEVGPTSRHGISVKLPPGASSASLQLTIAEPVPEGSTLAAIALPAPWEQGTHRIADAVRLTARATCPGAPPRIASVDVDLGPVDVPARALSLEVPRSAPGLRVAHEVARRGPATAASATVHLLIESPEIRLPGRGRDGARGAGPPAQP